METEKVIFDLLGKLGSSPVDGLNPDGLASLVASVGQLVLRGIEGEGLHDNFHGIRLHHAMSCHVKSFCHLPASRQPLP